MTENISQEQVSEMFNQISPVYDRINRILSFRIDSYWRNQLIKHLPHGDHLKLLDIATGTGDQLITLMKTGKFSEALGIDLAEEMLVIGEQKIQKFPFADQVQLVKADALKIPAEKESFHCITTSFGIRNVPETVNCLREMHRLLIPRGKILILEFSIPKNRLIKSFHLFYLRKILPMIGGLLSGKRNAYTYLNQTIESFPYGEDFLKLLQKGGFSHTIALPLTFGIATLYVGEKND